jgi:hypothetical protein
MATPNEWRGAASPCPKQPIFATAIGRPRRATRYVARGVGGFPIKRAGPVRLRLSAAAVVVITVLAGTLTAALGQDVYAVTNPARSIPPVPDYPQLCAPAGLDTSVTCLRLALGAIDVARATEGVRRMRLPYDFARLSVPEQLFVAVDRERVDRGLPPYIGLTDALDHEAQEGADAGGLPNRPGRGYRSSDLEWIGDVVNGLDADYEWMYNDGPGSGVPGCGTVHRSQCWIDRNIVLDQLGTGQDLVMGVAIDPTGDTSRGDRGGPSLAATLAVARRPTGPFTFTWAQAQAAMRHGTLQPLSALPTDESDTGIPDPSSNELPHPDYLDTCAPTGIDSSALCVDAVLQAVDHARAIEGVKPMVLPTNFDELSVPEQLFVAIDLERVDRGLAPFVGLTAALDRNAQKGADDANDPPDPGSAYLLVDGEWAGGSANGLDAVYGWMYDDGFNAGNLDCLQRGAPGCWGHRKGILDNFGSGPDLVMGTALDPTGDTNKGDKGGTSMAATLTVSSERPQSLVYTWAQVLAAMPDAGRSPEG